MYTAATVPVEKEGAQNPLLESAMQIGDDDQPGTDDDETPTAKSPKEPQEGSYERFMMTFGNPGRWAGR